MFEFTFADEFTSLMPIDDLRFENLMGEWLPGEQVQELTPEEEMRFNSLFGEPRPDELADNLSPEEEMRFNSLFGKIFDAKPVFGIAVRNADIIDPILMGTLAIAISEVERLISFQSENDFEQIQSKEAEKTSANALKWAKANIDNKKYGPRNNLNLWWPDGVNKCNKFVIDAFNKGNGENILDDGLLGRTPPTAADFFNGVAIGFIETRNPIPGDICTTTHHIGIVSGANTTISASSLKGKVVENDWGFRDKQGNGGDIRFYRYMGQPLQKYSN